MKKTFLIIILFFCIFSGSQIFSRIGSGYSEYRLIIGPKSTVLKCFPESEGEFAITWLEKGFPLIGNIRFDEDEADGEIMMTIDFSKTDGTGKFIKIDWGCKI